MGLRKVVVSHQPGGSEIFDTDNIMAANKLCCHFMKVILATIGNLFLQKSKMMRNAG